MLKEFINFEFAVFLIAVPTLIIVYGVAGALKIKYSARYIYLVLAILFVTVAILFFFFIPVINHLFDL